jgi:hypothetical protein
LIEEAGITQANVDQMVKSTDNPDVKRILGTEGKYGTALAHRRSERLLRDDLRQHDVVVGGRGAQALGVEARGITQANVDQMVKSTDNPDVKRILGTEGKYGTDLGPSGSFEMISGSTMLSSGAEARRRSA